MRVIGKHQCSKIGKKGYIKNGKNNAVKSATTVQCFRQQEYSIIGDNAAVRAKVAFLSYISLLDSKVCRNSGR
jgi:hypothetical protein